MEEISRGVVKLAIEDSESNVDVSMCQSQSDNDDTLASSLIDSSFESNDDEVSVDQPFAPYSVEELSLVKTLRHWSNCNVRVAGNLLYEGSSNMYYLQSIGEEGGPFKIAVDMTLIMQLPSLNTPVQVFGQIQLNSYPVIYANFFKDLSYVNMFYFNQALDELKKFVPNFVYRGKGPPTDQ